MDTVSEGAASCCCLKKHQIATRPSIVVVFTLKNRSNLCSVPSNIGTGPTEANAFPWSQANYPKRVHTKNQREIKGPRKVNINAMLLLLIVDSHIQRIVLATEETTVTQQVSHRPIKC